MAIGSRTVVLFESLQSKFVESKELELIYKSVSVSADGNDNGMNITEVGGEFSFNSKNFASVGTVNGVTVEGHAARHERGGADAMDGDHLDITFAPSNYTRSTTPSEADNVNDLTAHLAGIDDKLGTLGSLEGLDVKLSCKAALAPGGGILDDETDISGSPSYNNTGGTSARGQITATLAVSGVFTLDGIDVSTNGTRILLMDEASSGMGGDANGIWTVTVAGTSLTLDRATDFDEDDEVTANAFTFIEEGTCADCGFVLTTNDPITIGGASGTALVWSQFSSNGVITAGNGLQKAGNEISVLADTATADAASANAILAGANGTRISVDNSTIEGSGAGAAGAESLRVKDLGISTAKLAGTSVTAAKLGSDVAGNGLTGGNGSALAVLANVTETSTTEASAIVVAAGGVSISVDDSTLEGSGQGAAGAESLRVKNLGIDTAQLAATSVTAAKLGSDVAGNGLTGGNGSALAAQADSTGGANLATAINVSANGIAIAIDDSTIGENGSNQLEVKDAGITETQLNASVAGDRLAGGAGTALSVSFQEQITNGSGSIAIAAGDILYQKSDGTYELAKADVADLENKKIAIALEAIVASGTGQAIVHRGVRVAGFTGLTRGQLVYVVDNTGSAGATTQSAGGFATGDILYSVGRAFSATEVDFDPDVMGEFST